MASHKAAAEYRGKATKLHTGDEIGNEKSFRLTDSGHYEAVAPSRDRHKDTAGLALACTPDELAPELGGTDANAAPGFQHRQHDRSKRVVIDKTVPDILLERASLARGNEQSECFYEAADLVRNLGVIRTSRVRAATSVRVSMLCRTLLRARRKKPTSARCAKPSARQTPRIFGSSGRQDISFLLVIPTTSASCWLRSGRNPYENPRKSSS